MPAKFQLSSSLTKNILHLQLLGEFDGSAACELIKRIEEESSGASKIMIDTTELKSIHPFGRIVFLNRMGPLSRRLYGLTFLGKHKHQFES
jgi:ABC-type transporter Mla MlaB component